MKHDAAAAKKLKKLLIDIAPLIEEYTAAVCPDCQDICCKQKRSLPDANDVRYIKALGASQPERDLSQDPDGPCQFMGQAGCAIPRWLRPWRCTWYFCDPLIKAMNAGPQKKVRLLSALIQEIIDIRSSWL
jgi:hypothetical protein